MDAPLPVNSDPQKLHGATTIEELRIPVFSFFNHLAGGGNIESYREDYPWVPAKLLKDALNYVGGDLLNDPVVQNRLRAKAQERELTHGERAPSIV